ncbi:MAG TPA: hypothetical protein VF960_09255 [Chloroflexota bacterium]
MITGRRRFFGAGLGLGVFLGVLVGSVLVAWIGDEAAEAFRTLADRMLRRRDDVRFEALLQ